VEKEKSLDMKQRFLERGYSAQCVVDAHQAALSKSRQTLLPKSIQKDKHFSVTCITIFTPSG